MSIEHENFIKTPKQLIIIVVLAFAVPVAFIILLSQLMTSDKKTRADENPAALANRIKPVGELAIAGPKVLLTGDKLFGSLCTTCHTPGLAGAPKFGDKAAWAKVIAQGQATTVQHALAGIRGMPPRGGNPDLTDEEIAGAVVHMANAAGANWKAPELKMPAAAATAVAPAPAGAAAAPPASMPAPAAAPAPTSAPAVAGARAPASGPAPAATPAPTTAAAPAATPAPSAAPTQAAAGAGKGKSVYDTTCMVCHATGVAGAPKFGDKAAWAPRIATGIAALHNSSLKGKNAMPPKGGNNALPDADVMAAVDYMVAAAK